MTTLLPPPQENPRPLLDRLEDALLPLINLVFLLLMFFIVAGRLSDAPLPPLPALVADTAEQPPAADLIVTASGALQVNGQSVPEDRLLSALASLDTRQPLKIAAGQGLAMTDVERILRILEQGGIRDVILLAEPEQ